MESMHALGGFTVLVGKFQVIGDKNALDDQHFAVQFDLAPGFGSQVAFTCGNSARFQRATKGSGQSTGGRSNDIIKGRRAGFGHVRGNAVMFSDFGMDAKMDGVGSDGKICPAMRPLDAFNTYMRSVDDRAGHFDSLRSLDGSDKFRGLIPHLQ
jgi:hypothetical protein